MNYNPKGLVEAIKQFREGKRDLDSLADLAFPVLMKISKTAARKVGVDESDLTQEMWFTFKSVIALKFDLEKPIEPFIYGCAHKVALSLMDPHRNNEINLNEEGHAAVEAADQLINDDYHVDFIGDIDRKTALDKISKSLYDNNVTLTSKEEDMPQKDSLDFELPKEDITLMKGGEVNLSAMPAPLKDPVKRKKRPLTPSQQEVVDARSSLDMTQEAFAKELDINIFSLSSYEYGRANPPNSLLSKVRILIEGGNPRMAEIAKLKKTYDHPMSEILKKWCLQYKLDYTNDQQLALAMDTTSATIHRWKKDDVKPSVDAIEKYRQAFENGAKKMHYAVNNFKIDRETGYLLRV